MAKNIDLIEVKNKIKDVVDDFDVELIGVTLSVIVKQEDYKGISFSNYDRDSSIIAFRSVRIGGTRWVVQIMSEADLTQEPDKDL